MQSNYKLISLFLLFSISLNLYASDEDLLKKVRAHYYDIQSKIKYLKPFSFDDSLTYYKREWRDCQDCLSKRGVKGRVFLLSW
ncbi:hypothetical protein [Flammeovirga aprica]|uniref:Uncharacterized protein n=1 Tax=Flammeovirga aprica JL-4 TaxID=694437 RepID=A0A7X9XCC6_9BACT|nr:hypothetical protein [Flammeovirga aprica]NME71667.1 hypothetical protein [Flammeovirga aprica JL-4]